MPRSTARYAFEHGLLAWAQRFRGGDGFLALFDPSGQLSEVYVGESDGSGKRLVSHELRERVAREHLSWMYFDPFDWPEYAWLEWKQVPRATLEQMLGAQGVRAFGMSTEDPRGLPETWSVMF